MTTHDPDILFSDTLDMYIQARYAVDKIWQAVGNAPYVDSFELDGDSILIDLLVDTPRGPMPLWTSPARVEIPIALLAAPDWADHLAQVAAETSAE